MKPEMQSETTHRAEFLGDVDLYRGAPAASFEDVRQGDTVSVSMLAAAVAVCSLLVVAVALL